MRNAIKNLQHTSAIGKDVTFRSDEKVLLARLEAEKLELLYQNLKISLPANFLCASIVFTCLFQVQNIILLGTWYGAVLAISALRLAMYGFYSYAPQRSKLHYANFIIGIALAALLWGIAGSLLMPTQSYLGQLLVAIIMAGVTAGGLQTLQPNFSASLIFISLTILPMAFWLVLHSELAYIGAGFAMFIYWGFMMIVAKHNSGLLTETLKLRYENLGLISSLKKINDQLKYLATHDALTDLPNRGYLNELFVQSIARAKRHNKKLAVLFIDIDHFKDINDTFGHDVGDKLLAQVARRLRRNVRVSDIVSRLSGDEFVIILEDINKDESVEKIVKMILGRFSTSFAIDKIQIFITISVGISIYPDTGEDELHLLKNADVALYRAKAAGRNSYQYY